MPNMVTLRAVETGAVCCLLGKPFARRFATALASKLQSLRSLNPRKRELPNAFLFLPRRIHHVSTRMSRSGRRGNRTYLCRSDRRSIRRSLSPLSPGFVQCVLRTAAGTKLLQRQYRQWRTAGNAFAGRSRTASRTCGVNLRWPSSPTLLAGSAREALFISTVASLPDRSALTAQWHATALRNAMAYASRRSARIARNQIAQQ